MKIDYGDIISTMQLGIGGVVSVVSWLFGGLDGVFYALLTFIVIDILTGVLVAIADKSLSSEKLSKGLIKKLFVFFIIMMFCVIDDVLAHTGGALRYVVYLWAIGGEGLSIFENMAKVGVIPAGKLTEVLEAMQGKVSELDISAFDKNNKD